MSSSVKIVPIDKKGLCNVFEHIAIDLEVVTELRKCFFLPKYTEILDLIHPILIFNYLSDLQTHLF